MKSKNSLFNMAAAPGVSLFSVGPSGPIGPGVLLFLPGSIGASLEFSPICTGVRFLPSDPAFRLSLIGQKTNPHIPGIFN